MARKVFMQIEGMAGSSLEKGRDDWCDVIGFSHELKYDFDMGGTAGRGARSEPRHGAVRILKEIDKSSPKLYEALAKKKKIEKVTLEFERDQPCPRFA